MSKNNLPAPTKRMHKFLVWVYNPKSKLPEWLVKVRNLLSKAYKLLSNSKSQKDNNDRIGGKSILDIPTKSMFFSFLLSILLVIVIGNIFIHLVHWRIQKDLNSIIEEENGFNLDLEGGDMVRYAVIDKLIPHWKNKIEDAEPAIQSAIESNFEGGKITIDNLAKFIGQPDRKDELRQAIVGEINQILLLMPVFNPNSPTEIADNFGLKERYKANDAGGIDNDTWKRFIFLSAVQRIRDKLDDGIDHPRRLLLATGGTIQWITFLVAVWCLVLLLLLRTPWAKLQGFLCTKGYLPWHSDNEDVWDLSTDYKYELDREENYPNMFIPVRLVKEVNNINKNDSSLSHYQVIRERIEAYRDSVEIGEYEIINFLIWATPTFGFIGTIFGIISAMEKAAEIFSAPTPIEQGIALDSVSAALGTAFDTSFVALILLVPMSFFLARTRKIEADFFEELEFEAIGNLPDQYNDKN